MLSKQSPALIRAIQKRGLSNTAAAVATSARVELKPLPYELGDLEPVISGHLMDFHYGKHHRTYVNNLNALQEKAQEALATGKVQEYMQLLQAIKFNGGGHLNHEFFWDTLAPIKEGGGVLPDADTQLRNLIEQEWDSIDTFQTYFNTRTAALQGSGWGWLVYNKSTHQLEYI